MVLGSGALLLVLGFGLAVYRASQQVPDFYREALSADTTRQAAASKQMLQQATSLASEVQKTGSWEVEFTEEQINGWLAVDLVKNHADVLPSEVSDPRVAIGPEGARLGWRWRTEELTTVFSLDVEPYLAEPNVLALTIRGAHAGAVPLPLTRILDEVSTAAEDLNLQIRWLQEDGHPTALVTIPAPESDDKQAVVIETLELREGSIYLSGKTVPREDLADYCTPPEGDAAPVVWNPMEYSESVQR